MALRKSYFGLSIQQTHRPADVISLLRKEQVTIKIKTKKTKKRKKTRRKIRKKMKKMKK